MIKYGDLKKAPSKIEDADEPERGVIGDNDVRAAMGELLEALPRLQCQVQDEEEGGDDQHRIVPEPVAIEHPIEEPL